jgi:hypothetical protein
VFCCGSKCGALVMLDIRSPIGWLFVIISVLLVANGLLEPVSTQVGESSINLNATWGGVMGLFGALMLWLKYRSP